MESIIESVKSTTGNKVAITYFAYADNQKGTWFITPTKKAPYAGLLLLFQILCVTTTKDLYRPDKSAPVAGTVLNTIHGIRLEVIECEWI